MLCFLKDFEQENIKSIKDELKIDLVYVKCKNFRFYSFSHIFYSIFSRYPFYMKQFFKKEFENKLKSVLTDFSFDLVYIYDRSMILYGNIVKDIPKIIDSVDSQSLNSLSGFKSSKSISHKIFWYISYLKSKKT